MKVGDIIKIKPEWCDSPTDGDRRFVVVELNGDRLVGELLGSNMSIIPQERFRTEMVEVVECAS